MSVVSVSVKYFIVEDCLVKESFKNACHTFIILEEKRNELSKGQFLLHFLQQVKHQINLLGNYMTIFTSNSKQGQSVVYSNIH